MMLRIFRFSNAAFTLVEMSVAVILSTVISIFLMTLMTGFQKTAVELSGRTEAARDAIQVMYTLKNMIRKARAIQIDTDQWSINYDTGLDQLTLDADKKSIMLNGSKELGHGAILGFELKPLDSYFDEQSMPRVYQIILKIENPEAQHRSDRTKALEKALIFSTIVSRRVPTDKEPDPAWVKNEVPQCPPDCSGN